MNKQKRKYSIVVKGSYMTTPGVDHTSIVIDLVDPGDGLLHPIKLG